MPEREGGRLNTPKFKLGDRVSYVGDSPKRGEYGLPRNTTGKIAEIGMGHATYDLVPDDPTLLTMICYPHELLGE